MRNILARDCRGKLEPFALSSTLVAFDFDGTLAPIVRRPDRASMRAVTRRLLSDLTRLYRCIVISGRARADVRARLEGVAVVEVVGNHGMEPWHGRGGQMRAVDGWLARLTQRLSGLEGVEIEDKTFSVAVHYRRSRERKLARAAILEAATSLGDVRILGGKQVVNLLPVGAPHKGLALVRERERLGCDRAIYVGDDDTDEDVFALDDPGRLLTIRVGAKRVSRASYCIPSQRAIDELIQALVDLRQLHDSEKRALA